MFFSDVSGGGTPSDAALAKAAQQGDKAALNMLIGRYRAFAAGLASRFTGVSLERDDFIQEALLALLSAVYTFSPDKNAGFKTYAGVCILNRLRSVCKAETAEKNLPLNAYVPLDELELDGGGDPEGKLISEEEAQSLITFFERDLTPLEKQVLLYRIEGLSYAEISQKLHITGKSTDNALQRVRAKLKKRLDA